MYSYVLHRYFGTINSCDRLTLTIRLFRLSSGGESNSETLRTHRPVKAKIRSVRRKGRLFSDVVRRVRRNECGLRIIELRVQPNSGRGRG
jgi:hypothetical protein